MQGMIIEWLHGHLDVRGCFFWKTWDVEFLGMFKFGIWASLKMLRAPIAVYKSVVLWHSNYSAVSICVLGSKLPIIRVGVYIPINYKVSLFSGGMAIFHLFLFLHFFYVFVLL